MKKNNLKGIWTTIKKVVTYAKPHKVYFFLSLIFAFLAIGLNMFLPVMLGWAIDFVVGVNAVNFAKLGRILLFIGIQAVTSATFEWFEVYFENILTNTVTLIVHYLYLLLFMFESSIGWLQLEKNSGEKPYTEPPPTISISQSCRLGLNFLLILS